MDNRDYEISKLERRLANATDFDDGSKDDHIKTLEIEVDDARRETAECRQTISELQIHLKNLANDVDDLKRDKKHLEEQVESQHGVIESQKKKLAAAERQSLQNRKRYRNETDDQYRLELENQK